MIGLGVSARAYVASACVVVAAVPALGQGLFVHAMSGQPVVGGMPGEVYEWFPIYSQSPGTAGASARIKNGHIVMRSVTRVGDALYSPYIVGLPGHGAAGLRPSDIPRRDGESVAGIDWSQSTARIDSAGNVALAVRLSGPNISWLNDEVLTIRTTEGVFQALRAGDPVPGYEPACFLTYNTHSLVRQRKNWVYSSDGRFVSYMIASPPPTGPGFRVLASAGPGGPQVIARGYGPLVPATQFDGMALHEILDDPVASGAGVTAFRGTFDGSTTLALATVSPAGHRRLLSSGDPVPGSPGETFRPLGSLTSAISINDAGQISSPVSITRPGLPSLQAIVRTDGSEHQVVVRQGDPKPGRPSETFGADDLSRARTRISGSGAVAFVDQAGLAFVSIGDEDLRLAFDPLSPAWPGGLGQPRVIDTTLGMNASNQMVAALNFPMVGWAIAAWDPVLGEILLAYPGQTIELFPGVFRTIQTLDITGLEGVYSGGGQDGRPNALDDAGRVVFTASFTNNESAVLVATIPAPAGVGVLALGLLAMRRRR